MADTTINNPTNFNTHFLYKPIFLFILFLLLLPLLQDFKTINTTCWEFVQLVLVGIAVSYGLLSQRNEQTHKDEVLSVFDDDDNSKSPSLNNKHVETWNSQYHRGEPFVDVAKVKEATTLEKHNYLDVNNVVLPSPVPWRSRSGRMETQIPPINSPSFRYYFKSLCSQDQDPKEDMMIETKEDSEKSEDEEEEEEGGSIKIEEMVVNDKGPDVDKKADEFIAKFREQISQQRIATIRL